MFVVHAMNKKNVNVCQWTNISSQSWSRSHKRIIPTMCLNSLDLGLSGTFQWRQCKQTIISGERGLGIRFVVNQSQPFKEGAQQYPCSGSQLQQCTTSMSISCTNLTQVAESFQSFPQATAVQEQCYKRESFPFGCSFCCFWNSARDAANRRDTLKESASFSS